MKHLTRLAALPCCVCGIEPVQVHHIKGAGLTGTGQKCSDWFAIPLCLQHHDEFHRKGRMHWEMLHGSQADHLAKTLARLYA